MSSILEHHPITEAARLRRQLAFRLLQEKLTSDEMRGVVFACLTGSAGYGDSDEYSDIDLIVIHENLHRDEKTEIERIQADFWVYTLKEFKETYLQGQRMQSHFFPHMYPIFDPRGEFARLQADFDRKEMARHRLQWAADIIQARHSETVNLWRNGYPLTTLKQSQDQCLMSVSLLNGAVGVYPTVKWLSRDFKKACVICNKPEVYEEFLKAFRLDVSKERVQELVSVFFQINGLWREAVSNLEVFGNAYQTFVKQEGQLFLSGWVCQHVTGKIERALCWGTPEDVAIHLDNVYHQIADRWRMYLAQAVEGQRGRIPLIPLEDFLSCDLLPERHRILSLQLMRMEKVDFWDFQRMAALTEKLLELSINTLGLKINE